MYVCICVCVYVCMCVCVCLCVNVCMHISVQVHISVVALHSSNVHGHIRMGTGTCDTDAMMGRSYHCILALRTLRGRHRMQNCSNDSTTYYLPLVVRRGVRSGGSPVGKGMYV